jgi:hypothetical protein
MKYIILIISQVILLTSYLSQDINNLDKKNGYKSIILGSDLSSFENKIEQTEESKYLNHEPKIYNYTSNEYSDFLGIEFKTLNLLFFKNKLISIVFVFENKDGLNIYDNLKDDLEIIFDKSKNLGMHKGFSKYNYWESSKNTLSICQYIQTHELVDFRNKIHVEIGTKGIDEKILLDKF